MRKINTLLLASLFLFACNSNPANKPADKNKVAGTSVKEHSFMMLGNTKQYVEINSASDKLPVLLFIHGGPGWPQTPQLRYFNGELTKSFILVTWDQRGCGQSFMNDSTVENVSLEQIVTDAHELTQFLKKKFGQQKIFLAGFSWGSVVGLNLVQQYPADYIAYAGISQVINIDRGMGVTREWLIKKAMENKDDSTLRIVKQLQQGDKSLCQGKLECFMKQYELLSKYHGAVFNPRSDTQVEIAMTKYPDYKNYDWNKGFFYASGRLEKDLYATDFTHVNKLEVPVYFFAGRHDWNVPAVLVEAFEKKLQAPHKEMIWFENSGHGPLEEEPDKFNRVLIEKFTK